MLSNLQINNTSLNIFSTTTCSFIYRFQILYKVVTFHHLLFPPCELSYEPYTVVVVVVKKQKLKCQHPKLKPLQCHIPSPTRAAGKFVQNTTCGQIYLLETRTCIEEKSTLSTTAEQRHVTDDSWCPKATNTSS